jgi:hypothetical protein
MRRRKLTDFGFGVVMVFVVAASLAQAADADRPDVVALEKRVKALEEHSNNEPFLKWSDLLSVLFGGLGGGVIIGWYERRRLSNLNQFKHHDFEPYRKELVEQLDKLSPVGPELVKGMKLLLTSYLFVGGKRPRGQTFERDETEITYFKETRLPEIIAVCPESGLSETKKIREDCLFINVHIQKANAQLDNYANLLTAFSMFDEKGIAVRNRFAAQDNDDLRRNSDFLKEVNQAQTAFTQSVAHIGALESSISKELTILQAVLHPG